MEEKNINRLLKLCDEYFLQNRHCKNYIQHCKNTWYKGILSFMNELGVEDYSPDIGQKYLQSASGALLVEKYPRVILCSGDLLPRIDIFLRPCSAVCQEPKTWSA